MGEKNLFGKRQNAVLQTFLKRENKERTGIQLLNNKERFFTEVKILATRGKIATDKTAVSKVIDRAPATTSSFWPRNNLPQIFHTRSWMGLSTSSGQGTETQ